MLKSEKTVHERMRKDTFAACERESDGLNKVSKYCTVSIRPEDMCPRIGCFGAPGKVIRKTADSLLPKRQVTKRDSVSEEIHTYS